MRLLRKLSVGQRVASVGALALPPLMLLPWFGTKDQYTDNGILLPARKVTVNAWRPWDHEWFIAVPIVVCVAVVLFSVVRVAGRRASRELRGTASVAAAAAALLATLLVLFRVLVPIPNVVRWYGLFLCLLAAIVMLYGALRWMDEEGAAIAGVTVRDATRGLRRSWRRIQQSRQR